MDPPSHIPGFLLFSFEAIRGSHLNRLRKIECEPGLPKLPGQLWFPPETNAGLSYTHSGRSAFAGGLPRPWQGGELDHCKPLI